ncbi:PAS domain S-box protein [Dolichospermum sp. UHCC 0259]|uniref:PAS domain S-box protein n=1 Tax=Dolichospermum sp. UHCC 0259 TaxID=2590010 RepID=UPI0014483383|nr:PAS domain S-box protein [Dolichospermum sp. UHCC 0259]
MTNIPSPIDTDLDKLSATILIVDGSEMDRATYSQYLHSDVTTRYQILEAETVQEALEIRKFHDLDVVLIDFNLPDENGWKLLEAMGKDYLAKLPVIILIGKEDEKMAVSAIKKGAMDYLIKQDITDISLCHRIDSLLNVTALNRKVTKLQDQEALIAIQQAELYKNLQTLNACLEHTVEERTRELAASEQKFRAIFNNTFQFTGLLTTAGILLEANQTALIFGGIQLEDVVNRPFWETYWWTNSPENQDKLKQAIARAAQGEFIRYEVDVLGSGNQIATIDFSLRPLKDESEQVIMMIAEGRDITDKNHLEREYKQAVEALVASEAELRGLFNAMVDVILVLDQQGRYLKIAPTKTDNFYQPVEDSIGKTVHEVLPTHLADMCVSVIGQTLATQQTSECEYQLQINNQIVWFSAKVSPISEQIVIWAARDITAAKRSEIIYQQVEQALEENQILLQLIMDTLPLAVFWKDCNSRYLGCNKQLMLDAGLSLIEEIVGKTDFDMPWQEQAPLYQADDRIVITSGQPKLNIEEPFTKSDNIPRWLRTNKMPLKTPNGEIIGILASYEDITEQKEIERALKASEQRYAALVASAPVGIYRTDAAGNCVYVNNQWCENTSLTPEEARGEGWKKALHLEDRDLVETQWDNLVQTGEIFSLEYRYVRPDGEETWVFGQAVPEKDSAGMVTGYVGTITNISSRKQAESALRRSEQLYSTLISNFPNGAVLLFDHDLRYIVAGGLGLADSGLSKQQLEGKTIWEVFSTEVCEIIAPSFRQALDGQTNITEVSYGDRIYITYYLPVRDDQGKVIAGMIMSQDITERKQYENALKESEEKFRQFAENSVGVILLRQIDSGKLLYVNPAYEQIWQQPCESLYENPDSWMTFIHPDDRERMNIAYKTTHNSGFLNEEYRIMRSDGTIRWIWGRCFPIRDSSGKIYRIGAIAEDITKRKATEQERDSLLQVLEQQNQTLEAQVAQRTIELQQSKEHFRNLVETSSDWIWEVNEDGIYTYSSPQIINILGYFPAEVLGKSPFDFMPPEEAARVFQEVSKFASVQAPFQCLENINLHKDGRLITLETSAAPIIDEDGQFRGYRGMDRDVTVRKQIEITLRDSEEFNRSIFENNADCLKILDPDGNIISMNQAGLTLMEIDDPSQVLGKQWIQYWTEPDQSLAIQALETAKSGQVSHFQGFSPTHKGIPKWWDILVAPVFDLHGNILRLITTARDITANKQAEEQLHNLSDRFNLAIKSGQIGIWDWDIINNNVIWDERMYELYGMTPSEFVHTYEIWKTSLHPDDALSTYIAIEQAIAGTKDFDTEYRIIWADGTIKFIKAYAIVQRDSEGKAQRMIGINFDISDRKKSEAKLQAAEIQLRSLSDRLKLAVKSAKMGIWDFDLINDSLVWDERMYTIFGVSAVNFDPSQGAWAKFEQFVYPYDRVALREATQQVIANKQELDVEFRIVLRNGVIRIIKGHGVVQYNSQGQPQRMIGINYDITNRRREELQNKRLKDRLEFVLAASPAIIYTCQASGNYETTFISKNVQNVLGYTKETWLAEPNFWINHIHPDDLPQVLARLSDLQAQEHHPSQYRFLHQDGSYYWLEDEFRLVRDDMGRITEIIGYIVDISQRKQAETQLQETNQQLAASNEQLTRATRLKDEFLANMSHELRTPLNAILGISEGLQDQVFGVINERQRQSLQTIERSGTHLLELINDILDLSKIEAGQIQLDCTSISINQLCQSSLAFIKQQAFQKQIQLHVKIQPHLPTLIGDERRIRQVLINLLNNAVKFTLEGGAITLVVTQKEHPPESKITHPQDFIRIAVIDTGIGIAPENISKLFQSFVQIDSSLSRKYTGTGLGLSLVKRIVEMHGGQVDVSSEIGVGSSFFVDLPCANIPTSSSQSVNPSPGNFVTTFNDTVKKNIVILLAEDNKSNVLTFSSYLEAKGYQVISAKDGLEAIELTKSHRPDLILMDIQMPEMDGLEAIRQIRLNPDLATLPIIALTALVMPGDREKCLAAGANEYLSKPLKLKNLVNTIQQLLN